MTHLDEGTILAVRDGDWAEDFAQAHLTQCVDCSGELGQARTRATHITDSLAALDEDVDVETAKAAVRGRLDVTRGRTARAGQWTRWSLGKAAALLLLAAGTASALPWSPVRSWWRTSAPEPSAVPARAEPAQTVEGASGGGIAVPVDDGRIAVIVRGAATGASLEVVWVDEPTATVSAPPGSDFTYAGGRAEVDAAAGPIRVELPRAVRLATLEVDGVVYLARSGERLDVAGPVVEWDESHIRFVVPEP